MSSQSAPNCSPARRPAGPHPDMVLLALVGLLLAWGACFIARTSLVVDGRRYFCLFDDAMISMTYARNLVEGYGLNWARCGAPVEGFTNPLWALLMVPIHTLGISLAATSLLVQALSLILLVCCVLLTRALYLRHMAPVSGGSWLPAAILTAFYYPLNYWALMGMETGLQALLLLGMVYVAMDTKSRVARRTTFLFVILTASLLLRMDMAVPAACTVAYMVANGTLKPGRFRKWMPGLGGMVVVLALCLLFRRVYFGDMLPNTYYLKMTGVPVGPRLLRGALVFLDFATPLALPFAAVAAAALFWRRRLRHAMLLLALPGAQMLYSVFVGGDAWEWAGIGANRFIAPAMPLFFLYVAVLVAELQRALRPRSPLVTRALPVLLTALLFVLANCVGQPREVPGRWRNLFLFLRPPSHVPEARQVLGGALSLCRQANCDTGLSVAVVWAGIPAYFTGFRMVDLLGRSDETIARMQSPVTVNRDNPRRYYPGHMKWDYEHSLGELKPTYILQTWPRHDPRSPAGLHDPGVDSLVRAHGYEKHGTYWQRDTKPIDAVHRCQPLNEPVQ